mmetsp:Transcript_16158/g.39916  ORF Transcript_16158/g.39916 Transcript_16158/m.39916 type:complete len:207 (-) Transcript_16158:207-827(-)
MPDKILGSSFGFIRCSTDPNLGSASSSSPSTMSTCSPNAGPAPSSSTSDAMKFIPACRGRFFLPLLSVPASSSLNKKAPLVIDPPAPLNIGPPPLRIDPPVPLSSLFRCACPRCPYFRPSSSCILRCFDLRPAPRSCPPPRIVSRCKYPFCTNAAIISGTIVGSNTSSTCAEGSSVRRRFLWSGRSAISITHKLHSSSYTHVTGIS